MSVILFQILIFLAILIASKFGRKTRNYFLVILSIFTLIAVFTTALMVIQFFTILFGYFTTNSILAENEIKQKIKEEENKMFMGMSKGVRDKLKKRNINY